MKKNLTAQELRRSYSERVKKLCNLYNGLQDTNPFDSFPDLIKAISRNVALMELWKVVERRSNYTNKE